ncbi:hypothetical protein [Capnocytophaga catalasegens]|uniref:Uncharacterized protein n=1 Tax=Capnocytophaga catalasegens TaxID=1004260 RepID=A0AAV5ARI5_9FLAO|nr:hypothetical protein [Capnocytophaga catalasegens]GIZ14139.1 hypothetical protein RCZ03_01400 [Capnocytophaga catalasegens]GJM49933.1 hypothetical protein RCZ15_09080 [Capnocytophaga catalasegens]GJM51704.1 hypothetical protein RCZ16_00220 [Capnocytophaga catalasegens]
MIRTLMEANGNKPLMSQRESMQRFGITNPEDQIQQLQQEDTKDLNVSFL